ncbi:MAG: hypothetical protein WKF77_16095 [Planctomycetaceae bacterium]
MLPPLKLTPFEEYMLCDDRPDYPMTGFFRLRFSRKLNFQAMHAAIQTAAARHPLLRSRVCRNAEHGHYWATDETVSIPIEKWSADSQSEFPLAAYMDLTRNVGTRIWLVEQEIRSDLIVQVHHACSDALGKCQFIDDLLILYAQNVGELSQEVHLRPLDNQRLPLRNQFGLTWRKVLRMLPRQILGLHFVVRHFVRKATPLGLLSDDQTLQQPPAFPSPRSFSFDTQVTTCILSEARRRKVTVNDLLTRDLFLAIHDWRTQNGVKSENEWLRLFMPVNQRTTDDETLSAANIMGAVFLERNRRHMTNADSLLQSIKSAMQSHKHNQNGFLFIAALALMKRIPRLRNQVLHQKKCLSSCVFSNLGVILNRTPLPRRDGKLAIGDMILDQVDFIAPLRPLTAAAFCVYTYAGRLTLNLHFDPRSISKLQADSLLELFTRKIHESLKSAAHAPPPTGPSQN